jgi:transcriptional regulator with XRE-family HTH domain
MTQETLAERVKVPVDIIGKMERGTTASSFETVEKVAAALVLPPLALFGVGDQQPPPDERSQLLGKITAILAGMDEAQMTRAAKMLEAFAGA